MHNHIMRINIYGLIILCFLFLSEIAVAQMAPAVLIEDEDTGKITPLRMTELNIDISVIANIATTTMSMTFYNDLDRVIEGNLHFPLGEGQAVSRFAMTVDENMREGVVVEKAKGRMIFEDTVRQQIDPGLLEWTKGNNFKASIYPIPAKGNKKIVIAFEQELVDEGQDFLYLLPLNFNNRVDLFKVRAEIYKQDIKPELTQNKINNFKFIKWHESFIAEAEFHRYLPNKQIAFSLPKEKDRQRIFVEKDINNMNQDYFYISLNPESKKTTKTLPEKICLLWDVSSSVASRDIDKELSVLKSYFKKLKEPEINVIQFSDKIISEKTFLLKNGVNNLIDYLRNIKYDGGTQLGALDLTNYKCDEFILSTDGISNFGESDIKLSKTPVVVINSSQSSDHSYLRYISQATAGIYINLNKLTLKQAVESISTQTYSFISATYDKESIKETYPQISTPVINDFTIAGILLKDEANITLNFGFGKEIRYSRTINLHKSTEAIDNGLIKRIWAQKKIAELDMMYKNNREQLTELGKTMNIVTRNTSLVVLDQIEDYVMHRIIPPEDMRNEYFELLDDQEKETKRSEKEHMDSIIKRFEEQVEWWNTKFPIEGSKIKKTEERTVAVAAFAGSTARGNSDDSDDEFTLEEIAFTNATRVSDAEPIIKLSPWNPETPYLTELKKASEKEYYDTYLKLKKEYKNSSAFYLDIADFFLEKNENTLALRILSNIAEMELENHQLLRILGYRLMQLGFYKQAISVFEDVLEIREEEPQSYRDLALAYAADGQNQKAVDMLYFIVSKSWDERFSDIGLIALHEMNAIIAKSDIPLKLDNIDKRLLKNLPVDIRVVLTWDADDTDMDLWVIDPLGEKCFYSNNLTYLGGLISDDFTGGYGPEEFMLKKAKPGKYAIKVDYYGDHQQIIAGPTTVQVVFITNFGKTNENQKAVTMRLKEEEGFIDVGEFIFDNKSEVGDIGKK